MKYQAKIIVLLGLCGVSSLSAMQDNNQPRDPVTPANTQQESRDASVATPTAGYRNLQQELQTLYDRIRHTSRLLQRPLDVQHMKYQLRLNSKDTDKSDVLLSAIYEGWASKVRVINEASYITIVLKTYPKTCASLMTLIGGALLAGAGYGGYRLYQYYKEQQDQEETPIESPDNQVPVAGIITEQSSPMA